MKLFQFAGVLLIGLAPGVHAQPLDIGGIELHLGQKADEALRSLSSYEVQRHSDGFWIVMQKVGDEYQFLGSIAAKANVINSIIKQYPMNVPEDAPEAYTRASKELRRRGGATCSTREVEYTSGLIHEFETQCGAYRLKYFMPTKTDDGKRLLGAVSILIHAQ